MSKIRVRKRFKRPRDKTRVTVDFPIKKHRRLKAIAALKGETLQEFILHSVEEKMVESASKSKLETLDELGLLGAVDDSSITSTNYKEFIKKSIRSKHEK